MLLPALAAAIMLAACGGTSHKSTSTAGTTTTKSTATGKGATRHGLATLRYVVDGVNNPEYFRVTIYDLRRYGPFVILDFGYACADLNAGCDPHEAFTVPETKQVRGQQYSEQNTPNGVTLIDPVANKEYLPVTDGSQRPDTSTMPYSLSDTLTHLGWVAFAAPPAGTTSMDVLFPDGGPQVSAVPVSTGSAPTPQQIGSNVVAAAPSPFSTPPGSTDTTGLNLPVESLALTVGNPTGSDAESGSHDKITLSADVLFHFDKSNLTPAAHTILDHVATEIKARAVGPIQVTGYTDSIGTDAVNIPLSQARAQSVIHALTPLTPGAGYQAAGKGPADPVAPNTLPNGKDNPAGRRLNRRVTIAFQAKAPARPAPPPAPTTPSGTSAPSTSQSINYPDPQGNGSTHDYRLSVQQAYRDSNLLVVRVNVACTGVSGSDTACDGLFDFAGTPTVPPLTPLEGNNLGYTNGSTISTLYLSDPATGSEYIPVYRPDQQPVTAAVTPFSWPIGQSYPLWAYFPAPPATSTKVNVVLAGGGAIDNVPISSSPPALG